MGYQIVQTAGAEITMFSTNNITMDSDNIILENATLGTEHLTDWDMTSITGWAAVNSTLQQVTFDSKSCCRVTIGGTGDSGILQGSVQKPFQTPLVKGRRYKITASVYGEDLQAGSFKLMLGGEELYSVKVNNGNWVILEGRMKAAAANPEIQVIVNGGTVNDIYYIDYVSVKEITEGNLEVNGNLLTGGVITGNNLTPNFVPALFGIHWDASATDFEYTGGTNHDLLSFVRWSGAGSEEAVTQTITYNGNDQPSEIITHGVTSGRNVRETLEWDAVTFNLTRYEIDCNYIP